MRLRNFSPNPTFRDVLARIEGGPKPYALVTGEIYFIHAPGIGIKVGISKDPNKRMKDFRTAVPAKLDLLGSFPGDHTYAVRSGCDNDRSRAKPARTRLADAISHRTAA